MRLEGIEPPFQEPESYVRSITLQAQIKLTQRVPYYISELLLKTQPVITTFLN